MAVNPRPKKGENRNLRTRMWNLLDKRYCVSRNGPRQKSLTMQAIHTNKTYHQGQYLFYARKDAGPSTRQMASADDEAGHGAQMPSCHQLPSANFAGPAVFSSDEQGPFSLEVRTWPKLPRGDQQKTKM
jgi:hypothetical protein